MPTNKQLHTFVAYVEDKPGVLNRIASLFRRRNFNIESLTVGKTQEPGISRMTVLVEANKVAASHIEANLYKLVNVLRVEDLNDQAAVVREMVLVKVKADSQTRQELIQIASVFQAKIVDVAPSSMIMELAGTVEKVSRFVKLVTPFGILELQSTGVVAMSRGDDSVSPEPPALFANQTVAEQHKNGNGNLY